MKTLYLTVILASAVALSSCATLPSKPLTFNQLGQFESYPLNAQSYRISFKTTRNIAYGNAEEIALVKAAQTSIQNGYAFFKVLDDPSNRNQNAPRQAVVYPQPMYTPYPYGHRGRFTPMYDPFFYNNMPQVVTLDPTEVSYTIECYKNQKSAPKDAFDARLILQSLGQKYGVSPSGDLIQYDQTQPAPLK